MRSRLRSDPSRRDRLILRVSEANVSKGEAAAPQDEDYRLEKVSTHPERRRGQLYGRRKGPRLRPRQTELLETLLPELTPAIKNGADPKTYFPASVSDIWLEIGFGAGEHMLALARANQIGRAHF